MRRHGSIKFTPCTFLFLVLAGVSFAFLWGAPGVLATESAAGNRDIDRYLLGLVPPDPVRAASGFADFTDRAGLDPACGAGLADTKPFWEEIPPAVRLGHSAAFDATRKRMVVFGGLDGENLSNKTWVFAPGPLPSWKLLASQPPNPTDFTAADSIRRPSPRTGQATVLAHDRLLVIGGFDARGPRNDVWALDVTADSEKWTKLDPKGTAPRPRSGHTAVYDPVGDRVLVFGGTTGGLDLLGDVWALDMAADGEKWTKLVVVDSTGSESLLPSARVGHTAVYDPVGTRMLVFGGLDRNRKLLNDTWALSLVELSDTLKCELIRPCADRAPMPRVRHVAVCDAKQNRMLIFAGVTRDSQLGDVWELSLGPCAAWDSIRPAGGAPSGRLGPSAVIDSPHDRMLVFGGSRREVDLNDTWALPLRGTPKWTLVSPADGEPGARQGHAAVYDPVRDRMLMVGGGDGGEPLMDLWELPLAGRMSWQRGRIPGEAPPGRVGHTVVYDPVRDRLLVFGGVNLVFLDDLWELSLGGRERWARLLPRGVPPSGRADHTAIYDAKRDRIVVFGGFGSAGRTSDTWQLSLGDPMEWTPLEVGAPLLPAGRSAHAAVYDPVRDRMVVWGGTASPGDAWELRFGPQSEPGACKPGSAGWGLLTTCGQAPPWQFGQSAVYDSLRDRMVLFAGGFQEGAYHEFGNQVYALTLGCQATWIPVEPAGDQPRARVWYSAIYDPLRDRMVVYGGGRYGPQSYRGDLWTLTWGAAAARAPALARRPSGGSGSEDRSGDFDVRGLALALGSPQPNPTNGEVTATFTLPGNDVARIEIVDVRGRRVQARDLGSLGAGTHTVRINERGGLAAGVYLVRLSYGARTLTGKLAVLH